ncbi:uncharacterized protein [Typha latifolia]|uniref:uncharacterized protein n=1 Tax=Typha latifolia TaxID=4733 RepID=UPI003C2CDFAF
MMMEYEWGNPAATAAAMMLFGDNSGADTGQQDRTVFDHYVGQGLGSIGGMGGFFGQSHPLVAAAPLFSPSSTSSSSCHQRYGMALPPHAPARIGLNLGVRTYFSSRSPEDELAVAPRVFRRRTRTARCQVDGCGADLTNAKHYHRRHKVCEFHSKASIVIAAGLSQRFCQQCSRFHVLSEFDQGKRSCRKRLADHNRRRRKSQDLSTATINSQATITATTTTTATNDASKTNPYSITSVTATTNPGVKKEVIFTSISSNNISDNNNNDNTNNSNTESSVTHVSSSPVAPPPPAPHMSLGLGCGISPASFPLLPQLGDFRGTEQRFSSWVDETEDDYSIGGIYQNK